MMQVFTYVKTGMYIVLIIPFFGQVDDLVVDRLQYLVSKSAILRRG